MLCGLAGALYVPQVGIINPSEMQPSNSIEMAIWVAVGGRGTLIGGVLGAWLVNGGQELADVGVPVGLAVLPGRAVHPGDAVPAAGLVGLGPKLRRRARHGGRAAAPTGEGRHERHGRHAPDGHRKTNAPPPHRPEHRVPDGSAPRPRRHHAARPRATPRRPVGRRRHRQLRRLQGARRPEPDPGEGRAPLHHRPQRRRQDHADGRHHRQDPARQGRREARPATRPT